MDDRELSHEILGNIASSLDVTVQDVTDMNMRLKSHDGSLNAVLDTSSESGTEWIDFISDSKPNRKRFLRTARQCNTAAVCSTRRSAV